MHKKTYSPTKKLINPKQYDFPYQPYKIQQELMESLYEVLENKKIGIFESPTGTGKSLTLTCAALRWLKDHENLVHSDLQERIETMQKEIKYLEKECAVSKDWLRMQNEIKEKQNELVDWRNLNSKLLEQEEHLKTLRELRNLENINKLKNKKTEKDELIDHALDAAEQNLELDDSLESDVKFEEETENSDSFQNVQVFFCSRTHSQLAQVLKEVKHTEYGRDIRCVSLASRQQLCINPEVKRLPSVGLINEYCLEMARNSKKADKITAGADEERQNAKRARITLPKSCSFKATQKVQHFADALLTDIQDIEDLVQQGTEQCACPYYATRSAVASNLAQLIMLPYQMLFHRRTRLQSGIDLRGAIVIIDEAHNLLDTIAQLYSCELGLKQLQLAQQQITAYKMRYVKRFSSKNLLCINQLLYVVKRLIKILQTNPSPTTTSNTRILHTYELTAEGEFFNIDLNQLIEFCEQMRFAQKLQGFAHHYMDKPPEQNENKSPNTGADATRTLLQRLQTQNEETKQNKKTSKNKQATILVGEEKPKATDIEETSAQKNLRLPSPIHALVAFLQALTEKAEDGRVFVHNINATTHDSQNADAGYKYVVLNPGHHFADIVKDARAIVIAGGTMQPTNELTEQLFATCPERIELHFYDHVVAADAVMPFVVQRGPKGNALRLNYTQRKSSEMISEILMILQNLCQVVPAGLICFFPSYDYLDLVYKSLQESTSILRNIENKKRIFREPRTGSNRGQSVEQLLQQYAATINNESSTGRGALLFSVVGGKLSEGLNFADNLGRGVIVIGMPYANSQSTELQERMRYLDSTLGTGAGDEYYENLCMKAVNQCIGRSVRHINDYAAVYLIDERYARENIRKKLPQWICRSLQLASNFGVIQSSTVKFFKQKKLMVTEKVNT